MQIMLVQSFCPLVTRTSGGFPLNSVNKAKCFNKVNKGQFMPLRFVLLANSGEAGNATVIGTQLYFTLVQRRYKHGSHVERFFERERKTCLVLSRVVT